MSASATQGGHKKSRTPRRHNADYLARFLGKLITAHPSRQVCQLLLVSLCVISLAFSAADRRQTV